LKIAEDEKFIWRAMGWELQKLLDNYQWVKRDIGAMRERKISFLNVFVNIY